MLDYIRIACAVPAVKVGDVKKNTQDICDFIVKADAQQADVVVFPQLAMTGCTCGDLFFQDVLHKAVREGVRQIAAVTGEHRLITAVVGLPLRVRGYIYNCAAVFAHGQVIAVIPQTLPDGNARWFAPASNLEEKWLEPADLGLIGSEDYWSVPVGTDTLICLAEDARIAVQLGGNPASCDAQVLLHMAGAGETVGKRAFRRTTAEYFSAAENCVYALCSAGCTESTADAVFAGHSLIAEKGKILAENESAFDTDYMILCDCDLGKIRADQRKAAPALGKERHYTDVYLDALRSDGTLYPLRKLPFIPDTKQERIQRCQEIFQMQVTGLKQRLKTIGAKAVIGISGGLDSTLALLVAVESMRQLGRPLTDVYGVTMPCFGTSDRTYNNSWELMRTLGISAKEISIKNALTLHFEDIGHDISVHNGTFENSQARERTQILMDYASVVGGIVIGTGDLSELALGWCTYNGDHMSMYGVNGTIPKTLIRWMIEAIADMPDFALSGAVLQDILDTPISPELLPPDAQGKISQQTEDIVGPYALHDFFLYYVLRYGFSPVKIYTMACRAFAGDFDGATIKKWLCVFYRRFFTQQFKRNCMPDGVKVGSVALGPRGDWSMPSDATSRVWLEEADNL